MLKKALGWVKQLLLSLMTVEEGGEVVLHEVEQEPVVDWFEEAALLQEIERAHRYVERVELQKQMDESRRLEQIRLWRENNRMLDAVYAKLNKEPQRSQSHLHLVA